MPDGIETRGSDRATVSDVRQEGVTGNVWTTLQGRQLEPHCMAGNGWTATKLRRHEMGSNVALQLSPRCRACLACHTLIVPEAEHDCDARLTSCERCGTAMPAWAIDAHSGVCCQGPARANECWVEAPRIASVGDIVNIAVCCAHSRLDASHVLAVILRAGQRLFDAVRLTVSVSGVPKKGLSKIREFDMYCQVKRETDSVVIGRTDAATWGVEVLWSPIVLGCTDLADGRVLLEVYQGATLGKNPRLIGLCTVDVLELRSEPAVTLDLLRPHPCGLTMCLAVANLFFFSHN